MFDPSQRFEPLPKPHLTWSEYQACLTLDDDDRRMFLAIKRSNGSAKIIHFPPGLVAGQKRTHVVRTDIDLRAGAINTLPFLVRETPQKPPRLSRLINFLKRATRAEKPA